MNELKNIMEDFVLSMIGEILADTNVCTCELCKLDICAIALNSLPSLYIVTEKGQLFSKTNILIRQFEVDIVAAITNAAAIVKLKPRHEVPLNQQNESLDILDKKC